MLVKRMTGVRSTHISTVRGIMMMRRPRPYFVVFDVRTNVRRKLATPGSHTEMLLICHVEWVPNSVRRTFHTSVKWKSCLS